MADNDEPYVFPTPTLDDDLALIRRALRMLCDNQPQNPMGQHPAPNLEPGDAGTTEDGRRWRVVCYVPDPR